MRSLLITLLAWIAVSPTMAMGPRDVVLASLEKMRIPSEYMEVLMKHGDMETEAKLWMVYSKKRDIDESLFCYQRPDRGKAVVTKITSVSISQMLKKNRSSPRLRRISLSSGTIPRTNLPYVVLRMQSPVYYMQEGMTFAFTDASSANVLVVEAKFPKGQMHRIWIRQSDHAIVKVELFDKSGALYRTLVKNNIVTSNGHWFANTITVSDPEGQVTTITVLVRRDADEDGRFNQSEASRLCR